MAYGSLYESPNVFLSFWGDIRRDVHSHQPAWTLPLKCTRLALPLRHAALRVPVCRGPQSDNQHVPRWHPMHTNHHHISGLLFPGAGGENYSRGMRQKCHASNLDHPQFMRMENQTRACKCVWPQSAIFTSSLFTGRLGRTPPARGHK